MNRGIFQVFPKFILEVQIDSYWNKDSSAKLLWWEIVVRTNNSQKTEDSLSSTSFTHLASFPGLPSSCLGCHCHLFLVLLFPFHLCH